MLLKLLKKYNVDNYYFIYYKHPIKGHIATLVVEENPLEYIDVFNKEMVAYYNCKDYRTPLSKYPTPYQTNKITPRQAKKWAKEHFEDYKKYVDEQEEINNPDPNRLKTRVRNIKRPSDIYI